MANKVLLPNGKQQFCDANGNPYAGGTVEFYIPSTTTPKTTWQDSAGSVANANPVVLDSAGRASIYGNGDYRQILKNAAGDTIWDQVVSGELASAGSGNTSLLIWGGATGGTANAQTLTVAAFTFDPGQVLVIIPSQTSVAAGDGGDNPFTLTVNTVSAALKVKDMDGLRDPLGGEIYLNTLCMVGWDDVNGWFVLLSGRTTVQVINVNIASTLTLGQDTSDVFYPVDATSGSVTINLPTAVGQTGRKKTIKKITAANSVIIDPNGAQTIDGQSTITLTNQWDFVTLVSDGANWYIEALQIGSTNFQQFTAAGANTWTKPTGLPFGANSKVEVELWGGGGSGSRDTGTASNRAGGGGGGYTREICRLGILGATETVTVAAGGAAVTVNGAGNNGGNTTFGSWFTGYGGGGGTSGNGGGAGGWRGAASGATSGTGTGASSDTMFSNGNGNSSPGTAGYYSGGTGAGGGAATQAGGNSTFGGAGGGARAGGAGGTSIFGGNGGAAGNGAVNGTAGSQPGGGGGSGDSASNSGAGGAGMCRVWVTGVP